MSSFEIAMKRGSNSTAYNRLEEFCLTYRRESPATNEEIDDLYIQVNFFSQYYDNYPDKLKEGIMP